MTKTSQSNIIVIKGDAAKKFLKEAFHPDTEKLRERDAMFERWSRELHVDEDGDDLVATERAKFARHVMERRREYA